MKERRVLIGCNNSDSVSVELSEKIKELLLKSGFAPVEADGTEEFIKDSYCIITVGGDGTILRWGKSAARFGVPLLGINTGRLGFMATLEPENIPEIPRILKENLRVSPRMLMDVMIERSDGSSEKKLALNDVVISRESYSKLPEFRICSGNAEVLKIRADGVIMSTPTGSTAYSLAAGGPIIAPDMRCIEFTALCPHTLFARPMIFSADKEISVRYIAYRDSSVTVCVDGERGIRFSDGDILRLSESGYTLGLIEAGSGFYGAVHNKLMTPLK